jgi:hypothetical protein
MDKLKAETWVAWDRHWAEKRACYLADKKVVQMDHY